MIDSAGNKVKLKIRRMKCEKCRRIHHELPDCVVPYKRHCTETVEKIINGSLEVPCDDRTIRRIMVWWSVAGTYYLGVLKTLSTKHGILFSEEPSLREIVRATVNANQWISWYALCTRSE